MTGTEGESRDMFTTDLLRLSDCMEGVEAPGDEAPGDEDPGEEDLARRLERIETLLVNLYSTALKRSVEQVRDDQQREFVSVHGRLAEMSHDLQRMSDLRSDLARQFDVENVLVSQRIEFGWIRESLAWLRGVAAAGSPAPRRSNVAAVSVLGALAVVAALSFAAVALDFVRVDIGWGAGRKLSANARVSTDPAHGAGGEQAGDSAEGQLRRGEVILEMPRLPVLSEPARPPVGGG